MHVWRASYKHTGIRTTVVHTRVLERLEYDLDQHKLVWVKLARLSR